MNIGDTISVILNNKIGIYNKKDTVTIIKLEDGFSVSTVIQDTSKFILKLNNNVPFWRRKTAKKMLIAIQKNQLEGTPIDEKYDKYKSKEWFKVSYGKKKVEKKVSNTLKIHIPLKASGFIHKNEKTIVTFNDDDITTKFLIKGNFTFDDLVRLFE